MIARAFALNGVHPPPARAVRARPSGRIWPVIIVSLLAMNAGIVAITVFLATTDKSAATEPDYYAKAVGFDETIRQRETNARLGWSALPTLQAAPDGRTLELSVSLTDRDARPIPGAHLSVVAFASARSGQRQSLTLTAAGLRPGVYAAPIRIDRSGVWNFRISVTRAGDTFTRDTDLLVPDLPR